jgi:hypothetical protein
MHKKLYHIVFLCLFVISLIPSELRGQGTQDFENEKELIKVADKHFEKEEFVSALSMYSQLASTYPKNYEYNYRYGVCLLYGSEDKSSPIIFLNYALEGPDVSPKVYYYLGKSYHLSYRFDQAIKYYKLFELKYAEKDFMRFETDRLIQQCETAKSMLDNIKEINVYDKKILDDKEFFRAYRLEGFKGNILVVPVEIQSDYDIKKEFKTVTFHNPNYESIYFASKGKKGSGGSDIYKRNKLVTGVWGEPIALGMNVNTRYDENYPFLHPDGVTLYFCSKGHNSIGGYDVFKSKLDTATNIWGKPSNVGFAINSPGDDIMYVTDEFKNAAYFASNRSNRQGEITIYKITSDKKTKNYKVIKGLLNQDEQPLANSEITVFDSKTGEVVGVYQSDFDGEYYITIPEDATEIVYEVKLRGEKTVRQEISGLSDEGYEQKISIDSESLSMIITESEPIEISADDKANALAQNSSLNVNQAEDIAFNTKPINYNANEEEEEEEAEAVEEVEQSAFSADTDYTIDTDSDSDNESESEFVASNTQIVDDAYQDAEESRLDVENIKKQLDVAYMIASDKNEKAKRLASDIQKLNKDLEAGYDEEKAMEVSAKEAELTKLKQEVLVTYNVAKNLEENYKNKEEEAVFAQKYADDLKEAISSSSAEKAIEMLESTREELDRIYKKNKDAFNIDDLGGDADEKIVSLKQLSQDVDSEISAIVEEQTAIKQRAEEETEDYVKQSILLEAEDLEEELITLRSKKSKIDGELASIESEQQQFTENQEIFDEIASAESRNFSMEEIQKAEEAKSDLSKDVEIYANSETTEDMVESLADENEGELAITSGDENPSLDEINEHFDEIEEKEELSPVEKLAELNGKVKIQERRLRSKKEELDILESTLENETDLNVKSDIYKQLVILVNKTEEEMDRLKELQGDYNAYNEQEGLNQPDLEIKETVVESVVLSDSGEMIDFDTFLEEIEAEQLASANAEESESGSDDAIVAVSPDVTEVIEVEADELNGNTDSVDLATEIDEPSDEEEAVELSDEEIASSSFETLNEEQQLYKLELEFDMDSSSNEDVQRGLELAFGLKTDPNFEYGPNAIVQANVNNARRLERQALNTYLLFKKKRKEADEQIKASKAKKMIEEAIELESESKRLQESASANYAIANKEEFKYNQTQLRTAIATFKFEETPEYSVDRKAGEVLIEETTRIRSALMTTYDADERIKKINDAYNKELAAIAGQKKYVERLGQEEDVEESFVYLNEGESNPTNEDLESGQSETENTEEIESVSAEEGPFVAGTDEEVLSMEEVNSLSDEELLTKADNQTIEGIASTALNIRSNISTAPEEDKAKLMQRAALLEEVARTKRLKFVQKEYNDYLLMLKKNEEVRRRMAMRDENSEALFLVGLVERDIKTQTEALEKSKEDLDLYSGETQISAYKTALLNQQMIINKQTQVLKTYAEKNPAVSTEDLAYVNALPDTIQNVSSNFVIVDSNDPDLLITDSPEEVSPEVEVVEPEIASTEIPEPAVISGEEEGEGDEEANEELALNIQTENNTEEGEELTVGDSDESDENNELVNEEIASEVVSETAVDSNEEIQSPVVEEVAVAPVTEEEEALSPEVQEQLKIYTQLKAKSLKEYTVVESDIQKAQEIQNEAIELENEADNKLRQTESAQTEAEIEALIAESDKLRAKAIDKRKKANRLAAKVDNDLASAKSVYREAQKVLNSDVVQANVEDGDRIDIDYTSIERQRESIEAVDEFVAELESNRAANQNTSSSRTITAPFESEYIVLNGDAKYSDANPIPIDPAMPEGLVFKVQVGAFRNKIPQDLFKGIAPLQGESTPQGFIRYTAGAFSGFEPANMAKREIRKIGYKDAFVVVYLNGRRISLGEAFAMMDNESPNDKSVRSTQINKEVQELNGAGIGESYRDPSIAELVQDINETKGVMYTVQIGYYSESIQPENLFNLDPIYEDDNDGGYRYMHGIYKDLKAASNRKTEVRAIGIEDAFVIAYKDGNKISVADANRLIDEGASTVDGSKEYKLNTENTSGIVYKVQVGAYSQQVPLERAMIFVQFADQGIEHFQNANGLTIYSIGGMDSYQAAQSLKETIQAAGIVDAFITKYSNGKRL